MFTGAPKNSTDERQSFLKQALEARQAREKERKQVGAATTIQALYRSHRQRSQLKRDLFHRIDTIEQANKSNIIEVFRIARELMFIFNQTKDKAPFDKLCRHIVTSMMGQTGTLDATKSAAREQTKTKSEEVGEESVEPEGVDIVMESDSDQENLENYDSIRKYFASLNLNRSKASSWLQTMKKILHICCKYLNSNTIETQADIQATLNCLKMINIFTSTEQWHWNFSGVPINSFNDGTITNITSDDDSKRNRTLPTISTTKQITEPQIKQQCEKYCHELLHDLVNNASLYNELSKIITKTVKRCNTFLQKETLEISMKLALRPLIKNKFDRKTMNMFILQIMKIPCLIYHLDRLTPHVLKQFKENHILNHIIDILLPEQDSRAVIDSLDVNLNVCLLANLVHLAMIDMNNLKEIRCDYVVVITKVLEQFLKYVMTKQSSMTHCHPILGWFPQNIDSALNESMEQVKAQLYYLWNIKFIKILFSDLTKANELFYGKCSHSDDTSSQARSHNQFMQLRSSPRHSLTGRYSNMRSTSIDSSSTQPSFNFIRRVVERAASTVNKTMANSYIKSSTNSGSITTNKLMSQSASNVALVCYLYHTCLNTLTQIKRDILLGLCLQNFMLPNLLQFICSLGPNCGLKAFLDHLTLYTKTSAPEFHILTLFCDCATHHISILDDTEVYEQQKPFCIDDLVAISGFLNNFVFRVIWNNLIPQSTPQKPDPLLTSTHTLLTVLYKRDCRRKFAPPNHWLIKDIRISSFLKDLEADKPTSKTIMRMIPHILPHKERVLIFRRYVANDKALSMSGLSTHITIHRSRVVESGYQQLARLPPNVLKGLIRVKFINEQGLDEAGVDQDGVFKEFLEDTIKRVFDPSLNLFRSTSEQRLYPSPTSHLHSDHLSLFEFVGKMLGKAVYEGILVDVPFASFFLSQVLGQQQSVYNSYLDELPSLDPELHKSLTYIKHYEGDVADLDLTFSIDQDVLGKIVTYELEPGGRTIPVTQESRVRYIHLVAKFRMHQQIHDQTVAFIRGFKTIINTEWLSMFSTPELQRLISGDNNPVDIADLRKHTKYFGGFHNNHRVINWLWDILERDFTAEEHHLFLKFVTSCSKPPLLGFANLEPPFTIRCVEVSDDQDSGFDTVGSVLRGFFAIRRSDPVDRLPTSSTCFNLLKLPNYQRRSTLREKLRYAIRSNAGFELS